MNRPQLQKLAEERVLEAQALLNAGYWSGAYYLIGYAVECGLKSCVLARIEKTGVIFSQKNFAQECWTHNVENLVKVADLEIERGLDISKNPAFGINWGIVKDWNETARYQSWTESKARKLFEAVTNSTDGVLPWIKVRW